jgi:hypothetical protein
LGSQLLDRRRVIISNEEELRSNPTYLAMKKQQSIVDDANINDPSLAEKARM